MHIVGRIFLLSALWCAAHTPAFSATFSVVVVETGLGEAAPAAEASSAWESGIMAALFDAGHIVSNAPIRRGGLGDSIETAREGGARYLLAAELSYDSSDTNSKRPMPRSAVLTVRSLDPVVLLAEERRVLAGSSGASEDERTAKNAAQAALARMKDR